MIYGKSHPCGDKHGDELDVPCYLQVFGLEVWKFDTLWEHPLGKGEATCHSSWLYSFMYRRYVEGYYKSSSRHGMAENTLLVAEGIFAL